ncbi:hypothetical protein HK100_003420, partial [Physocladia obscura]
MASSSSSSSCSSLPLSDITKRTPLVPLSSNLKSDDDFVKKQSQQKTTEENEENEKKVSAEKNGISDEGEKTGEPIFTALSAFTYSNPRVHITDARDLDKIPDNLSPSGLSVKDGNCCPDSIILAHQSTTTPPLFRAAVISFIRCNQMQFSADIQMAYGCSVEQYLTNMSRDGEFGEVIFIMGACLVLGVSITVFTWNLHNGATSITSQTFAPIRPTIKTIQIHLDTGDSQLVPVFDPETGLLSTQRIITRQPHYDILVENGRRDSGVDLQ